MLIQNRNHKTSCNEKIAKRNNTKRHNSYVVVCSFAQSNWTFKAIGRSKIDSMSNLCNSAPLCANHSCVSALNCSLIWRTRSFYLRNERVRHPPQEKGIWPHTSLKKCLPVRGRSGDSLGTLWRWSGDALGMV